MKAIIGAFHTTASSALQIEMSLPPTDLRLRNRVLQSWTRMQTAPEMHPINFAIQQAISSQSITSMTPFEHLARTFPNHATPIETIKPYPGGHPHLRSRSTQATKSQQNPNMTPLSIMTTRFVSTWMDRESMDMSELPRSAKRSHELYDDT